MKSKQLRVMSMGFLSTAIIVATTLSSLVTSTYATSKNASFTPPQAAIDHLNEDDWSNLKKILSGIYGSITSPLDIDDVSDGSYTTGQLMGNGDIGVTAAGVSTTSQQFYFGKNDFWGTLHAEGDGLDDNQGILSTGGLDIRPTTEAGSDASSVFGMKQDLLNAQVNTNVQLKDNTGNDATINMNSWTADKDNVFVTEITNTGSSAVTLSTKLWVPKMAYASSGANDMTDAKDTYPYTGGIDTSGSNPVLWTTRDTNAGAGGNTDHYRSRIATATTVVGADLTNTQEKIEANDYYDSNKERYADSLGESGEFTIPARKTVSVVTNFASSSGAYDKIKSVSEVQEEAVQGISTYAAKDDIDQLKTDHLNWWKNYWLKSYVQFNDPALNKYYYGSLYVLGSSNRPTSQNGKVNKYNLPASMYGQWITADNMGWGGRYFLNYNQEAQYYASGSTNRIDTAIPYNRVIAYDLPWAKNNAAEQGFDGAAGNRTRTPFNLMANGQPSIKSKDSSKTYGFSSGSTDQKSNGMFAAVPMISYYEYTLDDDYLKNVLYPHLKQLLTFYSSYVLKQDDGNGQYHYSVIGSSIHEGDAADINADLDIGAIKRLSKFLLENASEMNESQSNIDRWKDLLNHTSFPEAMLPKGIFNANNNDDFVPTLIGTDYQSPNQTHVDMIEPGDQPVELEGVVFPFDNVQMLDGDKELLQKVRNTIKYMNAWADHNFAGWHSQSNGFCKIFPIAARAGWPAADLLSKFKTSLDGKVRNSNLTYYQNGGAVETIGSMEALDSMIIQSDTSPSMPSTISVFPNWDQSKSVSFKRLGAKGNVEVSSAYDASSKTVPYVDITSKRDGKIAVVNPWTTGEPVLQTVNSDNTLGSTVDYTIDGGKIIFDAQKGVQYMIMNNTSVSTKHVSEIDFDNYSTNLVYGGANGTDSDKITATIKGNPKDTLTWTSSNDSVAKVTGNGDTATIKAVGTGANKVTSVTVTAKSIQDPGLTQSIEVKVADVSTVPTSMKLVSPKTATIYGPESTDPSMYKVEGTDRLQLTATIKPENAYDKRIMWTSSDPNIAMVDKNGLVTARGRGTVTIIGTSRANPDLPSIKTEVTVTASGEDYSDNQALSAVLDYAESISSYDDHTTGSGGFTRVSDSPRWESMQEKFQKAYINALGVKAGYADYSNYEISKDTSLFAAIALDKAIRSIESSNGEPEFEFSDFELSAEKISPYKPLKVKAKVENTGGLGMLEVPLKVDGKTVDSKIFILDTGESKKVTFSIRLYKGGEHTVSVGNLEAKTVTVDPQPAKFMYDNLKINKGNSADQVIAEAVIENIGSYKGTKAVNLYVNDNVVDQKNVTLKPGETKTVRFTHTFKGEGYHWVRMGDSDAQLMISDGYNPSPDVPLSDLDWNYADAGWKSPQKNKSVEGNTLSVGGVQYDIGLGTHAHSTIIYDIAPGAKRFVSTVGVDNETTSDKSSVIFKVYADDQLIGESPIMRANDYWYFNVAIPGDAQKLKLIVDDAGDGINSDHADWVSAGFVMDGTPPVTTHSLTPASADGENGWYTSDVSVSLSASDNASAIARTVYQINNGKWTKYTGQFTISHEGLNTVRYRSIDRVANVEKVKNFKVNIDKHGPVIQIMSPNEDSYSDAKDLKPQVSVSDKLSGTNPEQEVITLDGREIQNGTTIPLYTLPLGAHKLKVTEKDKAGNMTTSTAKFKITTSVDSLKHLVMKFYDKGWIDNRGVEHSLLKKLRKKAKLKAFIHELKAQKGKHITEDAADYLLDDANSLIKNVH